MARLNPLSTVTDGLQRAVQLGSFGFFAGVMLSEAGAVDGVGASFLLAPLFAVVGIGYAVARYLRFEYELEADRLVVTSGVLSRQEREIPLRRIQNVDVNRGVLHRVLGLAVVSFETAGGGSTEAELDAVGRAEADRLREEVGVRARRARERGRGTEAPAASGTADESAADSDAGREPDRETLYEISTADLLTLSAVSFRPGAVLAPFFGAGLFDDLFGSTLDRLLRALGIGVEVGPDGVPRAELFSVVLSGVATVAAGIAVAWAASALLTFVRYYGFRLERVADELRYERGLASRYSGTVPLGKVQTLTVTENPLMRRLGYASLTVETAGYAPGSDGDGGGAETTVPLAARERVFELARDVYDFDDPAFDRPPERARGRYTRRYALLTLAVTAVFVLVDRFVLPLGLVTYAPLVGLPLAPVAARAKWRNRGYDELPAAFVARSGFWRRATRVVPYYRLQTVFVSRTPFQRRFDLASVTADTASTSSLVGGDAVAYDVDEGTATALRERLLDRLRADLAERRAAGRRPGGDPRPTPPDGSGGESDAGTGGDGSGGPDERSGDGSASTGP